MVLVLFLLRAGEYCEWRAQRQLYRRIRRKKEGVVGFVDAPGCECRGGFVALCRRSEDGVVGEGVVGGVELGALVGGHFADCRGEGFLLGLGLRLSGVGVRKSVDLGGDEEP